MTSKKNTPQIQNSIITSKLLLRILDLVFIFSAIYFIGRYFDLKYFEITYQHKTHILTLIFYILLWGSVFDLYNFHIFRSYGALIKRTLFSTTMICMMYFLTPILSPKIPRDRTEAFFFCLSVFLGILIWRLLYFKFLLKNDKFKRKSILICAQGNLDALKGPLTEVQPHLDIIGCFDSTANEMKPQPDTEECIKDINKLEEFIVSNNVSEIIVGPKANLSSLNTKLTGFRKYGVQIKSYTDVIEQVVQKLPINLYDGDFILHFPFSQNNYNRFYLIVGRVGDLAFTLIGLILTSLLLPFILLGNLIGNRGPLFYRQERVGKDGVTFQIVKFRSMVTDAERSGAVFAQKNDTRITKFGKFLRKTRLDELPQLINVLKNEMAIIGPRPERQIFVDQITKIEPLYPLRHSVKPGLTGWAQIKYRYGSSIQDSVEKLKYDLYYIKHRSLFIDAKIVVKTIGTVLFFKGQ